MLSKLTIRMRLVLLSITLLVVTVGTNVYLTEKLAQNAAAGVASTKIIELIKTANSVRSSFDDMRYWLTDLAVSLLTKSEENANSARIRVNANLTNLAELKPELAATIRGEVEQF